MIGTLLSYWVAIILARAESERDAGRHINRLQHVTRWIVRAIFIGFAVAILWAFGFFDGRHAALAAIGCVGVFNLVFRWRMNKMDRPPMPWDYISPSSNIYDWIFSKLSATHGGRIAYAVEAIVALIILAL